tara:strand:+ start:33 stop:242 length:210 start_codon:yes stop_codon:yes gene_type:complete
MMFKALKLFFLFLFWDDDGRCYYTGAGLVDGSAKDWPSKNGIWMQEIDLKKTSVFHKKSIVVQSDLKTS